MQSEISVKEKEMEWVWEIPMISSSPECGPETAVCLDPSKKQAFLETSGFP